MFLRVLVDLLEAYLVLIFARVILTWFPVDPYTWVGKLAHVLHQVTEPVMAPVRRIVPPVRFGGGGMDLSPIIVMVVLGLVISALGGQGFLI